LWSGSLLSGRLEASLFSGLGKKDMGSGDPGLSWQSAATPNLLRNSRTVYDTSIKVEVSPPLPEEEQQPNKHSNKTTRYDATLGMG